MGVLNVTPDSFSDGGSFLDEQAAVDHGVELVEQGAQILDVGGESTRPGAEPVAVEEELRRVVPVLEGLSGRVGTTQISIDTSKAAVAEPRSAPARRLSTTSALCAPIPRWPVSLPQRRRLLLDAHARRAAHDAAMAGLDTRMWLTM